MSLSWEQTSASTALGSLSPPSIIVGDPVRPTATTSDLKTLIPAAIRPTSTTTKPVHTPEAIGYFPGPDPSNTVNCETPDYTAFVTSTGYYNKVGCRKLDSTNQQHIYATSCIPAGSPHVVLTDPSITQCDYGIAQYCNTFSFSSPAAFFVACFTIANQTETHYLWPSQWSSRYADALVWANETLWTTQPLLHSATATATAGPSTTATATAEPVATSAAPAPGLCDEVQEHPQISVGVIAGVSAVAVVAFAACVVLLVIVWKRGRSRCCSRRPHVSASSEEDHVGRAGHGVEWNSEKKRPHELSPGEAHIHEVDGVTVASPRGLDEVDVFAGHWRSDTHTQTKPVSGSIRPGSGSL